MNRPIKKLAELTINVPFRERAFLVDVSSGIIINPAVIEIKDRQKRIIFTELWLGQFELRLKNIKESISVDTKGTVSVANKNLEISIRYYHQLFLFPKTLSRLLAPLHRWLSNFGWNYIFKISLMVPVCEYLNKEVVANLGHDGAVIPIPIDATDYPKNPRDLKLRHPSALLIQNHQIKQKSEALVSFGAVIEALPQVTFYISQGLPENQNNKYHQAVLAALTPLQNVQFVEINADNKYDYLHSTDLYILRSGLDCTPATILEAGLASKPIIASAVGGVPEMIIQGKTGWAIANSNQDEWIKKISNLIENKPSIQAMGKSSREHVMAQYSLPIIASKIYDLF